MKRFFHPKKNIIHYLENKTLILFSVIMPVCFYTSSASAEIASTQSHHLNETQEAITIKRGISHRDFSWSISSSSANLSPISTLDYKDVQFETTTAHFNLSELFQWSDSPWQISSTVSAGKAQTGTLVDSDFTVGQNSTLDIQSKANLEGSKSYYLDVAFQRDLFSQSDRNLTLSLGLSWQSDLYRQTQGEQTMISGQMLSEPQGFNGLDSRYDADWFGPFAGLTQSFYGRKHSLELNSVMSASAYDAEGQWNLRDDFAQPKSFSHKALGGGLKFEGTHKINLNKSMTLQHQAGIQYNSTFNGQDKIYRADGSETSTHLLPVKRVEYSYQIGFSWIL